jgi:hypothetical protein
MKNSKGSSVAIGDQGALDGWPESVVVPDRGGQGEQPLQHEDQDAGLELIT